MTWFLVALACAFAEALKDAVSKLSARTSGALTVSLAGTLIPLPYFLKGVVLEPTPKIGPWFFAALLGQSTLYTCSLYLYNKALRSSPLSLTVPLICFTPVFFLITSPLILGESVSRGGMLGIALIVIGAYSLYVNPAAFDLLGPLRAIFHEQGARLMLAVAFIWSITGNFDRMGVLNSSRDFWSGLILTLISLVLLITRIVVGERAPIFTKANILAGVLNGCAMYFYFWGISIQQVTYVITVKRCSVLFGVVIGYFYFGEHNLNQRLFGAALMVSGVVTVALAS